MSIDEILEEMDEVLEEAVNLPFSGGKRMVNVEHLRDLMGEIKLNLPDEVRQAKAIVQDRTDIVNAAKKESEALVRRAEERAKGLVSDAEIVKASQAKAAEILSNTQQQSREMRKQTLEYCDNLMHQCEDALTKNARDIREIRMNFQRGGAKPQGQK